MLFKLPVLDYDDYDDDFNLKILHLHQWKSKKNFIDAFRFFSSTGVSLAGCTLLLVFYPQAVLCLNLELCSSAFLPLIIWEGIPL
jgi:hypothetical protein